MNKNQEDYVAIVIPVIKVELYKDKYVENIKGGQNACVFIGDREQKDAKMGVHHLPLADLVACPHATYSSSAIPAWTAPQS
jgi:hypothetical protein